MGQAESGDTFLPLPWGHQAGREQWGSVTTRGIPFFLSIPIPSLPEPLSRSSGSALGWRSHGEPVPGTGGELSPRPLSAPLVIPQAPAPWLGASVPGHPPVNKGAMCFQPPNAVF